MTRALLATLLYLLCAAARAATGLAEFPGLEGDGPVTVFYPTSAKPEQVKRGPFTVDLAPKGAPERGNGRLVILSHGSGGSAWTYTQRIRKSIRDRSQKCPHIGS